MNESTIINKKIRLGARMTHFAAIAALGLAAHTSALGAEFDRIVAFGDSLMDSGNAFVLTGEIATPPFEPVPSGAYAIGGHHFSNGSTWVEQLGRAIGLLRSTGPSARNPRVFSNYAIGGSRARPGTASPSAADQVGQFLADNGGAASGRDLYLFGFGANDVRDAMIQQNGALIGEAVFAVRDSLLALCSAGAGHIVIANVPNVGVAPGIQQFGEPVIGFATLLSAALNQGVQQWLAQYVQPLCPGTRFDTLDTFALSTVVFDDPELYGFEDAEPCLSFGVLQDAICERPDSKFFWDAIHPTRAGHGLIAQRAAEIVN